MNTTNPSIEKDMRAPNKRHIENSIHAPNQLNKIELVSILSKIKRIHGSCL